MNNKAIAFSVKHHATIAKTNSCASPKGLFLIILSGFCFVFFAIYNFKVFGYSFLIFANIIFLINFVVKISLFIASTKTTLKPETEIRNLEDLPLYTILLPVYQEKHETVVQLIAAISDLNFPKDKLQVLVLVEKNDLYSKQHFKQLPYFFQILEIPDYMPKTKPKACNYGLFFAKGEFVVVYDADDIPDPNQLLRVISKFEESDETLICVQAVLNFYNKNFNILSKCFTLEYLMWFNYFLPRLCELNLFIPLGGTSNHFKTQKLVQIGGWDAYNVTEDAELGIRIAKNNFKSAIVYDYTMEEATFGIENWMRQRTRWMKGYLQTSLAHILDIRGNIKIGLVQTANLLLTVGFSFFTFFLIPMVIVFGIFIETSPTLLWLYCINILFIAIYSLMFKILMNKEQKLLQFGPEKSYLHLLMPFYFLLHVIASIAGFFEFIFKPFYWYRTEHNSKKILQIIRL